MTYVVISSDEALLWLRDYQAETARLGLEAIEEAQDAIRIINEVMIAGGWGQFETKNAQLATLYREKLAKISKRHDEIRGSLIARSGTN